MNRFGLLIAGIVGVCGMATWWLIYDSAPPEPVPAVVSEPSQAERLIEFCSDPKNRRSLLCQVDPDDEQAVQDAVERIIEYRNDPRIIERYSNDDDDDDDSSPRVNVTVPRETVRPSPAPARTTSPPAPLAPIVPFEVPPIPEVPEIPPIVPDIGLPLLP